MALLKENYITTYGTTAEHWVIQSININSHYKWCDITFVGYVNEDAYLNGADPIQQHKTKVNMDTGFENYLSKNASKKSRTNHFDMNIYELAYNIAKENDNFFKDCKNC